MRFLLLRRHLIYSFYYDILFSSFTILPAEGAVTLQEYGYIALFLLVSLAFAGLMLTLPVLLRKLKVIPHKPSAVKPTTVECGLETTGRSWVQFNPRYYFFAIIAVALDVMLVFIMPWAVGLEDIGAFAFAAGFIFVAILLVGYLYAWRKGVLEWK